MADYADHRPLNPPGALVPRPYEPAYPGMVEYEPPPDGEESGGQRISFAAVGRFKWTFLLILLLVAIPAGVVSFLVIEPEYEASASVQVWPTKTRVLYSTEEDARTRFFQQYINSQMGLITSRTILERTLSNPAVQSTRWFREVKPDLFGGPPKSDLERLAEVLKVSLVPGTFLLRITATASSADEAVLLANTIHDEYLRFISEQVDAGSELILDRLTPEERQLSASIEERERRLASQLRDIRVTSPKDLVDTRGKWIAEKRAELLDLHRDVAVYEQQLSALTGGAPSSAPAAEESEQLRFQSDSQWNNLHQRLEDEKLRLASAEERLGPRNPELENIRRLVASYEKQLLARETFLNERALAPMLRDRAARGVDEDGFSLNPDRLAHMLTQKKIEAAHLEQDIQRLEEEFTRDFSRALDQKIEADALERDKDKYRLVQRRIDELRMENSLGSISSAARAAPPSRPSNWKKPYMLTAMAFFGAAGLGFVAANWRAMRTPDAGNFARAEHAPVLGTIPVISQRKLPLPADIMIQEHIRIVRTGLLNRLNIERGAVLITSAGPSAGKTTVALMLARSLAQAGKRVLLVDADLYRPSVSSRLGVRPPAGLEDVLEGRLTDEQAIMSGDTPNLDLLPIASSGRVKSNELLANGVFEAGLKRWRARYDFVVLDAAPLLPVADARILLRLVDGTVMVAREGHCRHSDLVEALAIIDRAGGRLLGSVFVGARTGGGYRYRDYY